MARWRVPGAGLVLLAAAVAFFAITTIRHNQLLRDGTRTTGTVVRQIAGNDWNPFDNGRVVVRYRTPEGELTRSIWLDDPADAPATSSWTVVYDPERPGRVRSLTDANDPVPWGLPFLLAGLVGVALLVGGLWSRLRAWRRVREDRSAVTDDRIQLRTFWWVITKPRLEYDHTQMRIYLPGPFGSIPMVVARSLVCVLGPPDEIEDAPVADDVLIPYVPTTTDWAPPNLTLLFVEPQRIPPIRWGQDIGVSRRQSRSAEGAFIDGLDLRAVFPARAVRRLADAGFEVTTNPCAWMRDHRTAVQRDPGEIRRAARRARWSAVWGVTALVGVLGVEAVRLVIDGTRGWTLVAVLVGTLAAMVAVPLVAEWRDRRERDHNEPS